MTDATFSTVTIAGKEYAVRPLTAKQQRAVVPALMRLRGLQGSSDGMTAVDYDNLLRVVFHGVIEAAKCGMTFEQFLDLPVSIFELHRAVEAIMTLINRGAPAAAMQQRAQGGVIPVPAAQHEKQPN
jgi:hypothetical protein